MGVNCQDRLICFGVPNSTLGDASLFSDSGFLLIYESCRDMFKLFGMKTILFLEERSRRKFEANNDPQETGVWPVFAEEVRLRTRPGDVAIPSNMANAYLNAHVCPVDWVFTNRKYMVPHIRLQADDHYHNRLTSIVCRVMCSGYEGSINKPLATPWLTGNQLEAAAYLAADRIVWGSEMQRQRGFVIAKHFLAPSHARDFMKFRGIVIPETLPAELRPLRATDEDVRKRLQTKQDPFRVSFIGRMSAMKNVPFIMDVLQPLFAMHDIKLELVTTGSTDLPEKGYKRVSKKDATDNLVGCVEAGGTRGRHVYLNEILPRQQCVLYASTMEGHPAVPRETAYVGTPTLLPDRHWSKSMLANHRYPFLYKSEEEAMTLVLRIRDGDITDDEVDRFNRFRADPRVMFFTDDAAVELHALATELSGEWTTKFRRRSFSRILESFERQVSVGQEFAWGDLVKFFRKDGVTVQEGSETYSLMHVYRFLSDKLECINPLTGMFRRLS